MGLLSGCATTAKPEPPAFDANKQYTAAISTAKGDIVIELNSQKAPQTVENFVKLARQGFYNGLTFHRVEPSLLIQGGDPQGNGAGGPGYDLPAEISDLKHLPGTVATARRGDQVNPERRSSGSQFYICLTALPSLDNEYTIFGQVTQGLDVAGKIAPGDKMTTVTISEK
ncbi:MAG: peptidylprolyl isomerase [Chloroflexi bacterium]|nr:peptidylprolyl isomerase [Chloroflexota bacterium]